MTLVNIQPALAADADDLSALAVRSKAHWGYPPEFMEVCVEVLRVTQHMIETQPCYVYADDNGLVQGFYLLEKMGNDCDLDMLFVSPDAIGKGAGKALMAHALKQASELGCRRLLVVSDPHALAFYKAVGGVMIGWEESEVSDTRMLPKLEFLL